MMAPSAGTWCPGHWQARTGMGLTSSSRLLLRTRDALRTLPGCCRLMGVELISTYLLIALLYLFIKDTPMSNSPPMGTKT